MAVNAYLVIDGRPGPSTSMTNAIDILSFSFGASQSAHFGPGSSGKETRAGRADVGNISIMKVLDKTSPLLFDDCCTGNILTKVQVIYDKPTGDSQSDYFKLEMTEVLISSIQQSGSSENPSESISFAFAKIKMYYNPEDASGNLAGFIDKGFDLEALKPF